MYLHEAAGNGGFGHVPAVSPSDKAIWVGWCRGYLWKQSVRKNGHISTVRSLKKNVASPHTAWFTDLVVIRNIQTECEINVMFCALTDVKRKSTIPLNYNISRVTATKIFPVRIHLQNAHGIWIFLLFIKNQQVIYFQMSVNAHYKMSGNISNFFCEWNIRENRETKYSRSFSARRNTFCRCWWKHEIAR